MNTIEFTKIVEQYQKLIFTICRRFVNDYQEAENLTQETFLTAYRVIDSFVGDNYKSWLATIATNKCKDFLKSAYVRRVETAEDEKIHNIAETADMQSELEQSENILLVKRACEQLKEPYREVAVMHFIEEKSFLEISTALDVPIKTVQTRAYRARDKLKKELKEVLCDA